MISRMVGKDDRKVLLHLLRNPAGWAEEVLRDARLKAADELERLWRVESGVQLAAAELAETVGLGND